MKKRGQRFSSFVQSANSVNYRNQSIITSHFNKSISLYQRFEDILKAGDEEVASDKLRDAGTILYQSCEWALKHILDKRYNNHFDDGLIDRNRKIQLIDNLSTKSATLYKLLEWFKDDLKLTNEPLMITCNVILDNAKKVNNQPKHEGKIPDPNVYKTSVAEIRKLLIHYIDSSLDLLILSDSRYGVDKIWVELLEETNDFSDMFTYILVAGKAPNIIEKELFLHKWDMVIDMDSETDINGLCSKVKNICGFNPWIRTLNSMDSKRKFDLSNVPYWIMANGDADEPSTLVDPKRWKGRYGRNLINALENFHSDYTKPVKVFIYPSIDERNLERVVESFNDIYSDGDDVDFYMLEPDHDYSRIDYENFKRLNIEFGQFCDCIYTMYESDAVANYAIKNTLPSANSENVYIESAFHQELLDSFDVIFNNLDRMDEEDATKTNKYEFYSGQSKISWYGLKERFDVNRSEERIIFDKILVDMNDRGRLLKKVCYEPGVGGTTLMRRLAWNLRDRYPTLIMRRLNEQTIKNIQKIYNMTKLSPMIFIDNNDLEYDDASEVQFELKKMGFPFLICFFERRQKGASIKNGAVYTMLTTLNKSETVEMRRKLDDYVTSGDIRQNLSNIVNSNPNNPERSPFIMSMYTFEENFKGIKPYITKFLEGMSNHTKKVLFALSLADYGNSAIDMQYFIDLFEDNDIDEFLLTQNLGLHELVKIEESNGKKYLRIRYHLFGEEILCQMSGNQQSTSISFISLLDHIIGFIEDSRKNYSVVKYEIVNLLRKLFITRIADEDSSKPTFSPLISRLKDESRDYLNSNYDGSNDAISMIFNKLVNVYPEEHHFLAHLARYYFYIEMDYDKGFANINKAIDYSKAEDEQVDPLMYHMKAMGFSSRITNEYIREIYRNHNDGNDVANDPIINSIEDDAKQAANYFQLVRESNIGIAGHISEINLCIQIVSVFKNIIDESNNFGEFIASNEGKWIHSYIDNAHNLYDECKKMANGEDLDEIEKRLTTLTSGMDESITLWTEHLESNPTNVTRVRRTLARTIMKANKLAISDAEYQKNLRTIINLMEDNMLEEEKQSGNIRIWFESIMSLKDANQDAVIMSAITKLNKWITVSDDIEAHYYRFVLKFIQAKDGSSLAQNELPKLIREMKRKSINLYNRTTIQHWLTTEGEGLESLMLNRRAKKEVILEDQMSERMTKLTGRISSNYVNESNAYISYRGIEIFFNPLSTKGEIDKSKVNQRVTFGVGFSYDGPRAYNSSVKLISGDVPMVNANQLKLEPSTIVKCEVIRNVAHYVQVRIVGYQEHGSIDLQGLSGAYSENKRPQEGSILEARVLFERYDKRANRKTWMLTMHIDEERNEPEVESDLAKKLKQLNLKF